MFKKIIEKLKIVKNTNLNDEERFIIHKKNLDNKKILKSCYNEFYTKILQVEKKYSNNINNNLRIELGSGVGFIKKFDKKIITSDVIKNKFTDRVINANDIPYKNKTISSIFGIFCFHHFRDPHKFLIDIEKKLKPGGLCILIEPYYGLFASVIYKRIHKTEYFNIHEKINHKIKNKTAMENANQALSYIYFIKNKKKFNKTYLKLEILETYIFNNYLRFLLSGGLNFKQLIPNGIIFLILIIEKILSPFKKIFGIHYLIVLRRKNN